MSFKIISFYTEPFQGSKYYTDCANKFRERCEEIGVDYQVDHIKSEGDYYKNTRIKPQFILDKMKELKQDIIWLDIDCNIDELPKIPDNDLVFVKRDGMKVAKFLTIHSYAIYIKYCQSNIEFVRKWNDKCKNTTERRMGDHRLLFETLKESQIKYGFFENNAFELKISPREVNK
jgi:hypothetical protein